MPRERLSPDQAKEKLVEIIDDGRISDAAIQSVRDMAGLSLDNWPPADPVQCALDLIDEDTAPDRDEAPPSAMYDCADVLFSLQSYLDFEAGQAAALASMGSR